MKIPFYELKKLTGLVALLHFKSEWSHIVNEVKIRRTGSFNMRRIGSFSWYQDEQNKRKETHSSRDPTSPRGKGLAPRPLCGDTQAPQILPLGPERRGSSFQVVLTSLCHQPHPNSSSQAGRPSRGFPPRRGAQLRTPSSR